MREHMGISDFEQIRTAVWTCCQDRVANLLLAESAVRIFESIAMAIDFTGQGFAVCEEAGELCDEQMFEFGASHKWGWNPPENANTRTYRARTAL